MGGVGKFFERGKCALPCYGSNGVKVCAAIESFDQTALAAAT